MVAERGARTQNISPRVTSQTQRRGGGGGVGGHI